eukprot:jgi/Chlat1/6474/Chrsp45S05963
MASEKVATAAAFVAAGSAVVVVGGLAYDWYANSYKKRKGRALLHQWRQVCTIPTPQLKAIVDAFVTEMNAGLSSEGGSRIKMLPTYVDKLPTGQEQGTFYALDLGGSNFRVVKLTIGRGPIVHETSTMKIPHDVMTGTAEGLFDFIAQSLADFIENERRAGQLDEGVHDIGFTFSFPVKQTGLAAGTLINWTKGFSADGAVGEDVVALLTKSLKKLNVPMRVAALVNDTVGTLATAHYYHNDVAVGLILGTGTNAAYTEQIENIPKWTGTPPATGEMVINMEWGDFTSTTLPFIDADRALDADTWNKGSQLFEKMIGGMYLGDIGRRMLLQLAETGLLFGGRVPAGLRQQNFTTEDISNVFIDSTPDLSKTAAIVKKAFQWEEKHDICFTDLCLINEVCGLATVRAARMCAAGIAAVIRKVGKDPVGRRQSLDAPSQHPLVVAADGSLIKKHPVFKAYVFEGLKDIFGGDFSKILRIELLEDGSGFGAAMLAAVYQKS